MSPYSSFHLILYSLQSAPHFNLIITVLILFHRILATPPNRIKLAFSTLNLTGAINHCFSQYVEFWDIPTATSVVSALLVVLIFKYYN